MAAGVQGLGVCVRLQKQIQRMFPEALEERRREVEAHCSERQEAKQREVQEQVLSVQGLMRARFNAISGLLVCPPTPAPVSDASPCPAPSSSSALESSVTLPSSSSNSAQTADNTASAYVSDASAPSSPAAALNVTAHPPVVAPAAPTWQRPDEDAPLRQATAQKLVELIYRLRPEMETTFRQRLPSLVSKLEEGLYCTARTREHYSDPDTLEPRLQHLVRRLMTRQHNHLSGLVA
jgi:hypothetical protein